MNKLCALNKSWENCEQAIEKVTNKLWKSWISNEQAEAELGQAQLKLEQGFTSTKIWGIALMIANFYQLLHITEHG